MALNRRFQHNQHNLMVCVGQCEDLWYSHTLQDAPLTLFCKHFYDILLLYAGFAAVTTCFTHLHTVLLKTGGERFFQCLTQGHIHWPDFLSQYCTSTYCLFCRKSFVQLTSQFWLQVMSGQTPI